VRLGNAVGRCRENLQTQIDAIEAQLVGSRQSSRLDGMIGRADAAARFAKLDLDKQRVVVDTRQRLQPVRAVVGLYCLRMNF
jgi:hypothetical protein